MKDKMYVCLEGFYGIVERKFSRLIGSSKYFEQILAEIHLLTGQIQPQEGCPRMHE